MWSKAGIVPCTISLSLSLSLTHVWMMTMTVATGWWVDDLIRSVGRLLRYFHFFFYIYMMCLRECVSECFLFDLSLSHDL